MTLLRKAVDRLVEHEFHWAGTLFKLAVWWGVAFFGLVVLFLAAYRMKGMLSAIPPVIQGACLLLVTLATLFMLSMFRERKQALAAHTRFLDALADLKPATEAERTGGLSIDKMTVIRRRAASLSAKPREWWRALDRSMEYYASASGNEGWFITRPVRDALTEEDLVESFYNSAFHQSVPSILTALGLLATFVAILMALAGVTYNVNDLVHPVSGIDQLINGLSGKFLSSIVGLVLSVIFTLVEKKICDRQLRNAYDSLVARCQDVFPFLTQSRILLDIQRVVLGHTRARSVVERG